MGLISSYSLVGLLIAAAVSGVAWLALKVILPSQFEARITEACRAFATAIELRFPSHSGLTSRAASLCVLVADRLGFSKEQIRDIERACLLRDIGHCATPYALVNRKAFDDWSAEEKRTYLKHAGASGAMLELVPSLRSLASAVRFHHRPWQGKDAQGSADVPQAARILKAVVDFVWKERFEGFEVALKSIEVGAGDEYELEAAKALLAVLTSIRDGSSGGPPNP